MSALASPDHPLAQVNPETGNKAVVLYLGQLTFFLLQLERGENHD